MSTKKETAYRDPNALKMETEVKKGSPERCINMFNSSTSLAMFYFLRMKLETAPEGWLQEFLELDGLDSILDSLYHLTGQRFNSVSCTILSLDCVSCIRAILNTQIGLKYMVFNASYTQKLSYALTMDSTMLKKEVYEMMSVICAYNYTGYRHILDTLTSLKKETNQTYRFSVVVNELKSADTAPHKTAVLTFINCVINCTPDLVERNRIRNEFIGLQLLDILNFFRKEDPSGDLHLQLETFHAKKHADEEALNESDMDYNSPEDLIDIIQSKIFGTPKMASFINILQDLLSIELVKGKNGDKMWQTLEDYVHQTVHDSKNDPENTPGSTSFDLEALSATLNQGLKVIQDYQVYGMSPWQQPQSKLGQTTNNQCNGDKTENDTGVELTPKVQRRNFSMDGYKRAYVNRSIYENVSYMEEEDSREVITPTNKSALQRRYTITKPPIPKPAKAVKGLPLVKLTDDAINKFGSESVWVVSPTEKVVTPDFTQLETMFHMNDKDGDDEEEEVIFLNPSSSRNLNLFLSQLEISPEKLLDRIDRGTQEVDLPTLQYLSHVLPESEEISLLRNYKGRRLSLGTTEQFILLLSDIPDYMVHVQAYQFKAEAAKTLTSVQSKLNTMINLCKVVLENSGVKQFLHFILSAGNFLNYGGLRGEASGFKFSSLCRLKEVKSNIPNYSLLHHLVKAADSADDEMLKFVPECLAQDIKPSMYRELRTELSGLTKQLGILLHQLGASTTESRTRENFYRLVEDTKQELIVVHTLTEQLRSHTEKVATFFCEDVVTFDLEMTLKSFQQFCKQVQQCLQENATFQRQTNLARQKSEQLKCTHRQRVMNLEFGKDVGASSSVVESKFQVLEGILNDLKVGKFEMEVESSGLPPFENLQLSRISMYSENSLPSADISVFRTSSAADILLDEPRIAPVMPAILSPASGRQINNRQISNDPEPVMDRQRMVRMLTRNIYPAPDVEDTPPDVSVRPMKTQQQLNQRKSHNRSRSDITDSILDMEKWVKYEGMKLHESIMMEGHAPIAEPESSGTFDVTTLNLESDGRLMDKQDVKLYQELQAYNSDENVCSVQDGPILKLPIEKHQLPEFRTLQKSKPRGEKKNSLSNIFSRISRAVLRPRNSESGADIPKEKKGKRPGLFRRV